MHVKQLLDVVKEKNKIKCLVKVFNSIKESFYLIKSSTRPNLQAPMYVYMRQHEIVLTDTKVHAINCILQTFERQRMEENLQQNKTHLCQQN